MDPNRMHGAHLQVVKSSSVNYAHSPSPENAIKFDPTTGTLIMKSSDSQSALHHFYFPTMSQLAMYLTRDKELAVGIFFSEMSEVTVKITFDLFRYMRNEIRSGASIKIKWFVSSVNEETQKMARDFEALFELGTEIIPSKIEY